MTLTGFVAAFDMVGTDIVAARSNGGPTSERYAFGPGVDEPMVGYDNAGARYYFHADGHGNVVAHSGAAGSATRTIGYDEYGKPSLFSSRFLHAGKMHLGGVNAYYNNARFYDYNLGRFLQVDPSGYEDGPNLYLYVRNDPTNLRDPDGKDAVAIARGVLALIGTDVATPEPTDAAAPKWAVYAVAGAIAVAVIASSDDDRKDIPASDRTVSRNHNQGPRDPQRIPVAAPISDRDRLQRDLAFREGIGRLQAGRGTVIAGPGSRGDVIFRQAGAYAQRYGGKAADYVKVSATRTLGDGTRLSVHAVRNMVTGKVYDPKLIEGR